MKYVAEVPRFFTEVVADNLDAAKEELAKQAQIVARENSVIEDITDKEMPSPRDALTAKDDSLLNRIVNIFESGKSIAKATNGSAFLGIGGGDVLFGSDLCKSLGIADDMKPNMFLSFGGYLNTLTKDADAEAKKSL